MKFYIIITRIQIQKTRARVNSQFCLLSKLVGGGLLDGSKQRCRLLFFDKSKLEKISHPNFIGILGIIDGLTEPIVLLTVLRHSQLSTENMKQTNVL